MNYQLELDAELIEELDEEATLQGFDDTDAYVRWIIANRPMSDRATEQAPAVANRVSELEDRVTLIERQLDLDSEAADLGSESSSSGASLDVDIDPGTADEPLSEETLSDVTEPDEENAAADDEIADAIDDVALDDS